MNKVVWIALPLVLGAWDPIQSKNRAVEEGNQKYAAGDYAAAERHYLDARQKLPGVAGVHFDLGAALHRQALALPEGPERQAKLDAAEKELRLATDAGDVRLRSRAHYNLGNNLVERKKLPEAIQEYRKALKLDPRNEDARHNLELALRMKPPEPPPQSSPRPQDQQKPEDQPQQEPQQAPQQAGNEPPPPEQQPEPKDPGAEKQEQKPAGAEGERKLTDDDVERKLAELEKRSKDLQVKKAAERSQERRRGKPVKDW
jgi:tetratricopeptide (TPR) repeat protein